MFNYGDKYLLSDCFICVNMNKNELVITNTKNIPHEEQNYISKTKADNDLFS